MKQLPDALIFDMDGLLLDTEGIYKRSWSAVASELGFDLTDDLYLELIGITVVDCERRLQRAFGESFPLDRFRVDAKARYEALLDEEGIPLKPGVKELLTWAQDQGLPCGVGTSTVTGQARHHLEFHQIFDRFDAVIGGDQVSHGKPDPEIFVKVAGALAREPERCLVFEDAPSGIRAARAGGIPVVWVPDLLPPNPEVEELCAGVFSSLHHARGWLETLPAR